MPDKTFENKLNEQMGDFKFTPSDDVWQKLENDLRKRKKRRWAIIWFFSGLTVISAGMFFFTQIKVPESDSIFIAGTKKIKESESRNDTARMGEHLPATGMDNAVEYTKIWQRSPTAPVISAEPGASKVEDTKKQETEDFMLQQKSDKPSVVLSPERNKEVNDYNIGIQLEKPVSLQAKENNAVEKNNVMPKEGTTVNNSASLKMSEEMTRPELLGNDSSNKVVAIREDARAMVSPVPENNKKNIDSVTVSNKLQHAETKKQPLSLGIRFDAGRSANGESGLTLSKSADLQSVPASGGPSAFTYPYTQDPAFGWSLGIWLKKQVSLRVSFLAGLTYQQYQTQTAVGAQGQGGLVFNSGARDSIVDLYYLPGNQGTYQNRYHVLSVPLEMNVQLNKGKRIPFSWQFGVSPGWMISSNALHSDTSGMLYSDKSMFNQFQMGLQTGFSFRLWNKAVHPVELGPVFQYMLTPAFKADATYSGHLSFIGVRAGWTLFNFKPGQR